MAITRGNIPKELIPGLHALAGLAYAENKPVYKDLFEMDSSDRAFEEETMQYGFPLASFKQEASSAQEADAGETWTARYTHKEYALYFAISEAAMEDNLYDKLSERYSKELGRAFVWAREVGAAAVFNNATSSSFVFGDGVSLLNTAHPTRYAGNLANRPTTATDLSETAMEDGINNVALFVNERGRPLGLKVRKLAIPQVLAPTAGRILGDKTARPGTADRDINYIESNSLIPEGYVVNKYFTSTHAWFLLTDVNNGFKFFERIKPSFATEGDFLSGNFRMKGRDRWSVGATDSARALWGSP